MTVRRRTQTPTYYVHPERSSAGCDGWSPQFAQALQDSGATRISVGGPGWADLSEFVPFSDQIEELHIDTPIADMSHLSVLPRLETLYFGYNAELEDLNLGRLPRLETLRLAHDRLCETVIASAPRLKALYIQNCALRDLTALRDLRTLEYLSVTEAPLQSLKGIDQLRSLRHLVLSQVPVPTLEGIERTTRLENLGLHATPKLVSVEPVAELKTLRVLSIDGARRIRELEVLGSLVHLEELRLEGVAPSSLDFVSKLKHLRVLSLKVNNTLPSLGFLTPLKRLERLVLGERTIVEDGELSILLRLPALKVAAFRDRSHYSHRRKEIDAALAGRGT